MQQKVLISKFSTIYALIILMTVLLLVFCQDSYRHFNGITPDMDQSVWDKIYNRLYFSVTTCSKVGYGDITPKSKLAKAIVMSFMILIMANILSMIEPLVLIKLLGR